MLRDTAFRYQMRLINTNTMCLFQNSAQGPGQTEVSKTDSRTHIFASWKYNHYFEFAEIEDTKTVLVKCKLCAGRNTLLTAINGNGNLLLKHLTKLHRAVKIVAKDTCASDTTGSD